MTEQIALACKGLTKRFGGFKAVDDVSLTVREGTIHALIGPNGAGKTTCFNLLTRVLQPDSGRIEYFGLDVTRLQQEAVARLGLVRSFQISAVFLGLTTMQNVRVALMQKAGLGPQFWRPRSAMTHLNDEALRLLRDVGLEAEAETRAAQLPYGRKRALEIAMTLALDPKMLLLDEPMAGLGQEDVALITALIQRVSANRTVLMVEHNLAVVSEISNVITVLARGAILAEGDYQTISNDERVITAYMGVEHKEEQV